jgi:hypothetical protein
MNNNWNFINIYRAEIIFILGLVSLVFIMFGHRNRDEIQQVLKKELCKFPECSIDYWSASHFFLFAIFGFLAPNYPLTFFLLGAGFELAEDYLSADENTLFADCKKPYNGTRKKFWCNGIQDGYWYSNMTDSWVNLTGYIIGSAIRTVMFPDTLKNN